MAGVVVSAGEGEDGVVVVLFGLWITDGFFEAVSDADVGVGCGEEESCGESSASEVFAGADFVEGLGLDGGGDDEVGGGDLDGFSFDAVDDVSAA